jgi:hypothetical protein
MTFPDSALISMVDHLDAASILFYLLAQAFRPDSIS